MATRHFSWSNLAQTQQRRGYAASASTIYVMRSRRLHLRMAAPSKKCNCCSVTVRRNTTLSFYARPGSGSRARSGSQTLPLVAPHPEKGRRSSSYQMLPNHLQTTIINLGDDPGNPAQKAALAVRGEVAEWLKAAVLKITKAIPTSHR